MENIKSEVIGTYDNFFNPFIFKAVPIGSTCLDVGCWNGNMGAELIKRKKCLVYGIDCNIKAIEIAKKRGYSEVYRINFNNEVYNLPNFKFKFDVIIFADVLEHLINPVIVLLQLKEYLKKEGLILISIPNITFIHYRLKLLFGIWNYDESGVMDKTHLRFFTKKTIFDLAEEAGLEVVEFQAYNLLGSKYFYLKILKKIKILGKFFPELFSPQFLIQLKNG